MNIVEPAIERYISSLRGEAHPVVLEMEQLARRRGFPIVGPQVGQLLGIIARAMGARRVLELGSGFGYSAYWFARALAADGIVQCTDMSEANRDLALDFLGRAGLAQRIRFQVGDALEMMQQLDGPFDVVFNDVDKEQYPVLLEPVVALLRPGGLFITDNVLWKGRVAEPGEPDETTAAVLRFNAALCEHPALETCILPLRDGLAIAVKR